MAGGKASRMGFRDKPLMPFHSQTLIEHVLALAQPQVGSLVVSVNRNPGLYQRLNLPLVPDFKHCFEGPLVGIYSCMLWFQQSLSHQDFKYLACFPADVPEFPANVVSILSEQLERTSANIAYCCNEGQIQPLFSLWNLKLLTQIGAAIDRGVFGPKLLFNEIESIQVELAATTPGSFLNINSFDNLRQAERQITKKNVAN